MDDPFRSNPQAETELDLNEESDSSEPEEEPPMKPPEGLRLSVRLVLIFGVRRAHPLSHNPLPAFSKWPLYILQNLVIGV